MNTADASRWVTRSRSPNLALVRRVNRAQIGGSGGRLGRAGGAFWNVVLCVLEPVIRDGLSPLGQRGCSTTHEPRHCRTVGRVDVALRELDLRNYLAVLV